MIDPLAEIKPVVEIINNVSGANWVDDKNLIFFNDFEIWFYNLDNYNKYLIIRISEEINTALPFINKYYLLYSTAKDINVLELDARDKYNITKLISLEKNNGFFLSPDGQVIYFSGAIDNRSGVYKLEIQ
ncbi:MAG: hypothetical protein NTW06_02860 [Candidatus Falkowbacteria bacterium]|nr:hypothetical protein [Candidatus Falkowbacteria bacterium]